MSDTDSRLFSVAKRIRHLEQKIDEIYWSGDTKDIPKAKAYQSELDNLTEKSLRGVTLEPKF